MDTLQSKGIRVLDRLFNTGYPHPINLFAALMLLSLPVLTPLSGPAPHGGEFVSYGLAGLLAIGYLLVWARVRVHNPPRSARYLQAYLFLQTVLVSLIYVLGGGLNRFLFVVVAVQAAYVTPVKRWAPFLGSLGALWLVLYLVISPHDPGASQVAVIGMYLCYLVFAAVVTFTTVQQEKQVHVAQELLDGVDQRHEALRAYDLTVEHFAEVGERERLAQTIYADLLSRLQDLTIHLNTLLSDGLLNRANAREARLGAKEVMNSIRQAVRTLRPGDDGDLGDEDDAASAFPAAPAPVVAVRYTDPLRIYHVWNIGVIVITTGVMVASDLVGRTSRWEWELSAGLTLLGAYALSAVSRHARLRAATLVLQAALCVWMISLSHEPLMSHLLMIVAAQMVFLVPATNQGAAAAIIFPTLLAAGGLWSTGGYRQAIGYFLGLCGAFMVTYFFSGVMAYMTRRQVEARQQAVLYAQQMAQINKLLEERLVSVRRMAIAQERIRMSREIHDSLGHHLTAVIMELQYAEELADAEPNAARSHIRSAQRIIDVALVASREMGLALERFDRPLPEAISELVSAWRVANGANVFVHVQGDFTPVSTAVRITVYRAVQESLTNIQKHAQARRVDIHLQRQRDRVLVTISNDSDGQPPAAPVDVVRGGFGLVGLKERADALQGEFWAGTRPGGGFLVRLILPIGA